MAAAAARRLVAVAERRLAAAVARHSAAEAERRLAAAAARRLAAEGGTPPKEAEGERARLQLRVAKTEVLGGAF